MISKFLFLLDGNYVSDPKGWEELDTTIKRDQALSGLLISQEAQLEFYEDGYTYIKGLFDTRGFCTFVEIEIRQTCDQLNYEQIFKGVIYLSDCIFDLMRCSVKVKTVDDGFYARINNNKSIKAKLDVGRSKNDFAIPAASAIPVQFFDPATGVYDAVNMPNVFTVYEVFKFLVAFMTDDRVGFVSNIFGAGGDWEYQCITNGNEVRLQDQAVIPMLSFQEVFSEVNNKDRIGFAIEIIAGKPTLRIEDADYFYGQTSAVTLTDAKEVVMQMDVTQLYSKVHLGSSIVDSLTAPVGQFPEGINFLGFKDEEYHIVGTCNVDTTLELSSEWIISSNIIEDIFVNGNDGYDTDIILVDVIKVYANYFAVRSNWLGITPPPYYYNEVFNNQNTVKRWLGGIPNSIAQFLGNADNTFLATTDLFPQQKTGTFLINFAPVGFDNDYTAPNHDVNNNYGNGTAQGTPVAVVNSRYTVPISGAGVYTFETSLLIGFLSPNRPRYFELVIRQYDVANTIIRNDTVIILTTNSSNTQTLFTQETFNAAVGDYFEIFMTSVRITPTAPHTIEVMAGSYFACTYINSGGGMVATTDPSNYKIKKFTFKYPVTFDQLKTIKLDTKKLITFTTNNGVTQTGWIDTLKYYHHNKVADITLITN